MDGPKPVLDFDPDISAPLASGKPAPSWLGWAMYRWLARRPVLLIRGELSDILATHTAERMCRSQKTTCVQIPNVGHAPLLDEIEARDAINAWLKAVP